MLEIGWKMYDYDAQTRSSRVSALENRNFR